MISRQNSVHLKLEGEKNRCAIYYINYDDALRAEKVCLNITLLTKVIDLIYSLLTDVMI